MVFHGCFEQLGGFDAEEFVEFALSSFGTAGFTDVVNLSFSSRDDECGIAMGSQETAHRDPVPCVASTIKLVADPLPKVESDHGDKDVSIDAIFIFMKIRTHSQIGLERTESLFGLGQTDIHSPEFFGREILTIDAQSVAAKEFAMLLKLVIFAQELCSITED